MESGLYSNEKYNRIIAVFGGRIGVGIGKNKERKTVSLLIQELEKKHKVGEEEPENWDKDKPTIQFIFEEEASIDIVMKLLSEAKKILNAYVRTE